MKDEKMERLEEFAAIFRQVTGNLGKLPLYPRLTLMSERAARLCGAEACGTLLVKGGGQLRFAAGHGYRKLKSLLGQQFPISDEPRSGLTGFIAHTGALFNSHGEELNRHFAVRGEKPKHLPSGACHSLLAVPLKKKEPRGGERLLGLLRLDNKKASDGRAGPDVRFTKEDELILTIFAEVAVAALDNADVVMQLREQKDRLAGLLDCSPTGIVAFDREGHVTLFNEQAEHITGYKAQDVIDRYPTWLSTPHDLCERSEVAPPGGVGRRRVQYESLVKNKAGETLLLRCSSSLLFDADGVCAGSVGYFEDTRARKKAERRCRLLLEGTRRAALAPSLAEGMLRLLDLIASILPHTFCRIMLLNEAEQTLEVGAACRQRECSLAGGPLHSPVVLREWPGLEELIRHKSLALLRIGEREYEPTLKKLSQLLGLESVIQTLLLVPLKIEGRIVGLLEFGEVMSEDEHPFTEEDIDFCASIAERVSTIIDRMHMHEQTRRSEQLHKMLHEALLHMPAWRGTHELLPELVRMALKLLRCEAGGLFLHHARQDELELAASHGLPAGSHDERVALSDGALCEVAHTGKAIVENDAGADPVAAALGLAALAAAPLLNEAGEVEAVLFVGDASGRRRFDKIDLEVLGSLAAHASLATRTSRLLTQEQRTLSKLNTLHKFSHYVQAEENLGRILHAVLTGVTADYGLRFNRAALFFLDLGEKATTLAGEIGVGHLDEHSTIRDWERDEREGRKDLRAYLAMLSEMDDLPSTPIDKVTRGLRLHVSPDGDDVFSKVIRERRPIRLAPEELSSFPPEFASSFEPSSPCAVVPLEARGQVIGVLVVDNKFTQVPISDDDVNLLHTFANGTATAIDSRRLLKQTQAELARLRALYEASVPLCSGGDPLSILQHVVDQPPSFAGAAWVRVILINEAGRAWRQIIGGIETELPLSDAVRPEGISVQVMRSGVADVIEDVTEHLDRVNPFVIESGIRAALCLPLALSGKNIGVMWINYDAPRRFEDSEIRTLQIYANLAAITYDKARALEESERLNRAKQAMSGAEGLKQVLRAVIAEAKDMFHVSSCSLWSYDHMRDKLLTDDLVADGFTDDDLQTFKDLEPAHEGTVYAILDKGWVGVTDTAEPPPGLLGPQMQKHLLHAGVKSFQGVALRVGDEDSPAGGTPLGVLYLNYEQPRVFGDEERRALKNFATHAALALRNARLLDQVTRTNSAAEVIAHVSALEEDPDATLLSVVEGAKKAVGCDAVVLYAYNETKNEWHYPPIHVGVELPDEAWPTDRVPDSFVAYKIFELDEPYYVAEMSAEERRAEDLLGLLKGRFAREEKIVSCMALPLRAAGRNVGVMFVNHRTRHRFASDDLSRIRLFADQAAVAIRNFQLFKESGKKLGELEALVKLSRALLGASTRQETVGRAVEVAAQVLDVKHCNIVLRAEDGRLILAGAHGWDEALVGQYEMSYGRGSQTGFTIIEGGPVVSYDLEHEGRFRVLPLVIEHGLKSSMSVPMRSSEGEIIGAMLVHTREPHRFTEAEVNLLSLVANQTAVAVQRTQLFEDLKQTKGLVGSRTALAWMNMASGIWLHAVNTYAVTIRDQVELLNHTLRQHAPDAISPELLADVVRRSDGIREVADAILSKVITPPLSGANVDSVPIDVLVRERVKQLWMKEPRRSFAVETTVGSGALVRLNEFWFNQALDQLVDNALKAMAHSAEKRLSIDVQSRNSFVEIAVRDTGAGFPPHVLLTLFNKRVEKEPGSKGLGMGLLMAQCIVEAYRGELRVESTGPAGTTMVIRLPREHGEREAQATPGDFLLVGDAHDPHWRDLLQETLQTSGRLEVVGEHEADYRLSEKMCRAVIIDAGAVDNFALLTSQLRTRHPDARIIVVTASPSWEFARDAFRSGATDYLRKSVAKEELSLHLQQALTKPLSPWPYNRRYFTGEECHAQTNAHC